MGIKKKEVLMMTCMSHQAQLPFPEVYNMPVLINIKLNFGIQVVSPDVNVIFKSALWLLNLSLK